MKAWIGLTLGLHTALLGATSAIAGSVAGPTLEAAATLPVPTERTVAEVLGAYVDEALRSNLALQAAGLEVERSQAMLEAARARFFPEATLNARYTRAEGGREVSLPLAAAFNPVYATLNELLLADGKAPRFGSIEDPRFLLQREEEQDSRISLRQPLYAPALPAAVRAQRAAMAATSYAKLALEQRLQRDVSVGYLDWLRANRSADIVAASRALLQENLRINESLFRNGTITEDQVLRARAELLAVEQQLSETRQLRDQARSYLNFLLNRPLDTMLDDAVIDGELVQVALGLEQLRALALTQRPDVGQFEGNVKAMESRVAIARAARLPSLGLAVDGGTQGEKYEFGRGRNYATVSLLLNWTLFDGGARRAEEREAKLALRQIETQRMQLAQQIALEVQQALDRLQTSQVSLQVAEARAAAARAAFRIAGRKRDEGVISQVEFLDARTSLTAAELNLNAVRFESLARQADLDYATGAPRS
ncbi:MAG: hypothetical protein RLZZ33_2098 [Pseudomonadota bacterium]|jgi:outer membrane protein TolC